MKKLRKITDFFLVNRPETENKWWHRLFIVLLCGSGILIFLITLLSVGENGSSGVTFPGSNLNDHSWISYKPVAFSLESNYQHVDGKEFPCHNDLFVFNISDTDPAINSEGIKCDGVVLSDLDSKRYSTLYRSAEKNLERQFGLDKYNFMNYCPQFTFKERPFTDNEMSCFRKSIDAEQEDMAYPEYQSALKNLARIKVATDIHYSTIINDIVYWLTIPIIISVLWLLFWSPIVYRSILYIIFGKKIIN